MYRIMRQTHEGYLKDANFARSDYKSYLQAEAVMKGLKKSHPKWKMTILQFH